MSRLSAASYHLSILSSSRITVPLSAFHASRHRLFLLSFKQGTEVTRVLLCACHSLTCREGYSPELTIRVVN